MLNHKNKEHKTGPLGKEKKSTSSLKKVIFKPEKEQ